MISPTLRQGLESNSPSHHLNITFVARVQTSNIGDLHLIRIACNQLNLITGAHFTFPLNGEIESRPPTRQKPSDDVCAAELDTELIARHTWLSEGDLCGTDAKPIADVDR